MFVLAHLDLAKLSFSVMFNNSLISNFKGWVLNRKCISVVITHMLFGGCDGRKVTNKIFCFTLSTHIVS